jgi:uncharacterized protein (TIGR02594 family)
MYPTYALSQLRNAPWLRFAYGELRRNVHRFGTVDEKRHHLHPEGAIHDNPRILQYLQAVGISQRSPFYTEETSWCSAFANWCMMRAGIVGTKSAMARSWLHWGNGIKIKLPVPGAVVVFSRANNPHLGHVAFVWDVHGARHFTTIGGNQGERPAVPRSHKLGVPSGVTISKRHDVPLGFFWPKQNPRPSPNVGVSRMSGSRSGR